MGSAFFPRDDVADRHAGRKVTALPGKMLASVSGLTYEGMWGSDRFATIAGFKHYYLGSRGTTTNVFASTAVKPQEMQQHHHDFGGLAAVRYRLTPHWLLRVNYERAARLPDAKELFGDGYLVQGSAHLKPEHAHNFGLGGRYERRFAKQRRVMLEFDAFRSEVRDYIVLGGVLTPSYANVGQVRIHGVEANIECEPASFVWMYANATWQDVRNVARYLPGSHSPNFLRNKRVPNQPYLFANFGSELSLPLPQPKALGHSRLKFHYDGSYVAGYSYEYQVSKWQSHTIAPQMVHSAGLIWALMRDKIHLAASIHNFTDRPRMDQFARPLPGRTWRFHVRLTFI